MDMTHSYWEDNSQRVKFERCLTNEEPVSRIKDDRAMYPCCDSNLNFSTATCSEDDSEYGQYKKSKVARQDPMSHRIIEKRRRDRMNNCLADLSRLIPTEYLKKGRGRIEKTEIIEMAIKHMKHLQSQDRGSPVEHYRLGYQECMSETMRFMVEVEGHFPREPMVVRLLNHLQKHGDQISKTVTPLPQSPTLDPPFAHVPVKNEIPPAASVPKAEPENSNSNDAHFAVKPIEDKDVGSVSYKYKTNIKLRFNQDLNAHEVPKRQKLDDERRSSVTSFENHSSSQSSPPSEPSRISEPDLHRQSPDPKLDTPRIDSLQLSPTPQNEPNFNIPIFVLHTKGSYYIPLTIDYKTLRPFLQNINIVETSGQTVLHPVTINVNFVPVDLKKYRYEYNNNWH